MNAKGSENEYKGSDKKTLMRIKRDAPEAISLNCK